MPIRGRDPRSSGALMRSMFHAVGRGGLNHGDHNHRGERATWSCPAHVRAQLLPEREAARLGSVCCRRWLIPLTFLGEKTSSFASKGSKPRRLLPLLPWFCIAAPAALLPSRRRPLHPSSSGSSRRAVRPINPHHSLFRRRTRILRRARRRRCTRPLPPPRTYPRTGPCHAGVTAAVLRSGRAKAWRRR